MRKHYGCTGLLPNGVPVQNSGKGSVHPEVAELAHREYLEQGHRQSLKRIHERGGFSWAELALLLADALLRVKNED